VPPIAPKAYLDDALFVLNQKARRFSSDGPHASQIADAIMLFYMCEIGRHTRLTSSPATSGIADNPAGASWGTGLDEKHA
jgi:hypothetical protein